MYSYADRIKAVKLYIKYDLSATDTVRELGYPSRKMLVQWYQEYQETGELHDRYIKQSAYTAAHKQAAVGYYLEHGCSINRTIRALGYPKRHTLPKWVDELAPGGREVNIRCGTAVRFTEEQQKEAVIELCTRAGSAAAAANKFGTSRYSLYKW